MSNENYFAETLLKCERLGAADLLRWLGNTDFFIAPASTRFHDCEVGGLVKHSVNVYDCLSTINKRFNFVIPEPSIIICGLLHDICKADCYKTEQRWRKVDGQWEQYSAYTFDEDYKFGGHGSKSVFLIQQFMKLNKDEAAAINSHMGAYDDKNVASVYETNVLAWALHVADEMATFRTGWTL